MPTPQKLLINNMPVRCTSKTSPGWWKVAGTECIGAYQGIGAASRAESYINLANTCYDLTATCDNPVFNTESNNPIWRSRDGWTFDGAKQYLSTNIVLDVNYSMIIRYSHVRYIHGKRQILVGTNFNHFRYSVSQWGKNDTRTYNIGTTNAYKVTYANAEGVDAISGFDVYINGTHSSTIPYSVMSFGFPLFFGAGSRVTHAGSSPDYFSEMRVQALAIYTGVLPGYKIESLTRRMEAL